MAVFRTKTPSAGLRVEKLEPLWDQDVVRPLRRAGQKFPDNLVELPCTPAAPLLGVQPKGLKPGSWERAALPGAERHHPQQPRHRAGLSAHGQAVKRGGVVRLSGIQPSTAGNSARWEPMGELTGHYAK